MQQYIYIYIYIYIAINLNLTCNKDNCHYQGKIFQNLNLKVFILMLFQQVDLVII